MKFYLFAEEVDALPPPLQSTTLLMRAFFLSVLFPRIIRLGRAWLSGPSNDLDSTPLCPALAENPESSSQRDPTDVVTSAHHASPPPPAGAKHGSSFDLYFLQWSIFLDGILTALITFSTKGWHMYLAAVILPFASGTATAAKGLALDFVDPENRADALSGIALIESLGECSPWKICVSILMCLQAQISTIGIFGYVFAGFSEIGRGELVFAVNGVRWS